eukprot:TRINITY_DN6068_c0_g2_i5.p1 TRINITY_DN6068_c0_g2~~TRINITY_DN6068_c0_g2_i5.p1  ORF type:complete len:261 (-),score=52.97 TRINITY_DN6068_c0_g2_i5:79-861(-)
MQAVRRGVFGVPSFFVQDRLIYGVDRLYRIERELGGTPSQSLPFSDFSLKFKAPVDFFFDFSSPYTYLAATRANALFGRINLNWCPILLGAVFRACGMANLPVTTMSPAKSRYNSHDLLMQAKEAGIEFQFSSHFPLRTVVPLRITLMLGPNTDIGQKFIYETFRAAWVENKNIADTEIICQICEKIGLNGKELVSNSSKSDAKQLLVDSTEKALASGCFGAPSFVVPYEGRRNLFWGNDKLVFAVSFARKHLLDIPNKL